MRKYTPVTVFVTLWQRHALRVISEFSRSPLCETGEWSQSGLVRDALVQYIQALEELDDAVQLRKPGGKALSLAATREIERAIKADR